MGRLKPRGDSHAQGDGRSAPFRLSPPRGNRPTVPFNQVPSSQDCGVLGAPPKFQSPPLPQVQPKVQPPLGLPKCVFEPHSEILLPEQLQGWARNKHVEGMEQDQVEGLVRVAAPGWG